MSLRGRFHSLPLSGLAFVVKNLSKSYKFIKLPDMTMNACFRDQTYIYTHDTGVEQESPMFQLTNPSGTVIGPKSATTCCANNYRAKFDVSIALNIANICSFQQELWWNFCIYQVGRFTVDTNSNLTNVMHFTLEKQVRSSQNV